VNATSLYVHYPWCVRKCPYCDFDSHPIGKRALPETDYIDALIRDLQGYPASQGFRTVFFGGGTPSLFSPGSFARLLAEVFVTRGAEITVEANPGATEHRELEGYIEAGINRLSLGAQSFDDSRLAQIGRIHSANDIASCFHTARTAGFCNINLDLMYALPGQSPEEALTDLRAATDLKPEHISWYQLTIEPRTEFANRPPALPDIDTVIELETEGRNLLAEHGYRRYEVSAYALAGKECQHNLNYWSFGDYVGIGAGAHGKLTHGASVVRTVQPRQPRRYLAEPCSPAEQPVIAAELPAEFMMNALRLVDGVPFEHFEASTGVPWEHLASQWHEAVQQGLVRDTHIAATALGYDHLNALIARFL
jgi:oxygen-independent coproporphyrinogen-3 oxidase